MNLQDVSHIHIPDGDVRMIHDSDNRLLWGAVGYNVLFSGNTYQQTYTGKNLFNNKATPLYTVRASAEALPTGVRITTNTTAAGGYYFAVFKVCDTSDYEGQTITLKTNMTSSSTNPAKAYIGLSAADGTNRVARASLSASGSCSYTIEQDTNRPCVIVALYSTDSGTPVFGEYVDYTDLQIEVGSTATSYEPYVGGQPSPNPEYPQPIQTVTGEQTVEIQGRDYKINLIPDTNYWDNLQSGFIPLSGSYPTTNPSYPNAKYVTIALRAGQSIRTIFNGTDGGGGRIRWINPSTNQVGGPLGVDNEYYTSTAYYGDGFYNGVITAKKDFIVGVLELGDYYDSDTFKIEPVNFGGIELCKLGTYQDYIWKDGESWKVHKATASGRMSSADNWVIPNPSSYPNLFQAVVNRLDLAPEYVLNSSALEALCEELTYMDSGAVRTAQGFAIYNNDGSKLVRINHADFTTVAQLKDWLSNNNVEILFALATPTDTTITDQTLIAQLEAIYNLVRRYGYNFVVSVSGNNLPIIIDRTLL